MTPAEDARTPGADEVVALSARTWEWMSTRNVAELAELLHEDAVFVHMGATFTKAQEIEVISTGYIHYRDIDVKDVSVRIIGDTAIVLTTLDMVAIVDGNEAANPFVVTQVYVRPTGAWNLASMSFTRLLTA